MTSIQCRIVPGEKNGSNAVRKGVNYTEAVTSSARARVERGGEIGRARQAWRQAWRQRA